jgi:hypothetical protein
VKNCGQVAMHDSPHLRFKARWRHFEGRVEPKIVAKKAGSDGKLNRFNCGVFRSCKPLRISSLTSDFSTENLFFTQPSETNDLGEMTGERAANKTYDC